MEEIMQIGRGGGKIDSGEMAVSVKRDFPSRGGMPDKPARQSLAGEAGRFAAKAGAIASRPVTAKTAAGRAGQIAARSGALAGQAGRSLRRAASTPEAMALAFETGNLTRRVVNTVAARAKQDTARTVRGFGSLVSNTRTRMNARRGFGK